MIRTFNIKTAHKNYDFILNQIELANNFSSQIVIDHVRTSSKEFIDAIDIETNSKIAMEVVMHSSKKSKALKKIDRPKAYILKKNLRFLFFTFFFQSITLSHL